MKKQETGLANFVTTHFVDEEYHKNHSQLIHQHKNELELLYVMLGTGKYSVNGREYFVRPGNLIVCGPGIFHGELPFEEHSMTSICVVINHLTLTASENRTLESSADMPVLYYSGEERRMLEEYIRILRYMEDGKQKKICDLLANAMLYEVLNKISQASRLTAQDANGRDELVKNMMLYLNDHFMEPLNLQQMADIFGVSKYTLSHIFKEQTGSSPMRYAMQRKIGESQNLLMNTRMPIGEISDAMGFNNNCHFSAMFKKYVGLTPTEYREHFSRDEGLPDPVGK